MEETIKKFYVPLKQEDRSDYQSLDDFSESEKPFIETLINAGILMRDPMSERRVKMIDPRRY